LKAVVLDNQIAAPADKKAPPVVTLGQASAFGASKDVCQGFPVVAKDSDGGAWLSWLEADVKLGTCLGGAGQGGVLRLARLDAGAAVNAAAWAAVAGEACSVGDPNGPMFLEQGFALLDAGGADPATRGVVSARPQGANLNGWLSTILLKIDSIAAFVAVNGGPSNPYSKVHPVVVDLGKAAVKTRYWTLALAEKAAPATRYLWAQAMDKVGVADDPILWQTGVVATPGTTSDFNGITAVCSLDAAADANGAVGAVVVVRRGGKDELLFVSRSGDGLKTVVSSLKTSGSGLDCRTGLSAARVVSAGAGSWVVATYSGNGGSQTLGTVQVHKVTIDLANKATAADITPAAFSGLTVATTDSVVGPGFPTNALDFRGLADIVAVGGVTRLVIESLDASSGKHQLLLYSFAL